MGLQGPGHGHDEQQLADLGACRTESTRDPSARVQHHDQSCDVSLQKGPTQAPRNAVQPVRQSRQDLPKQRPNHVSRSSRGSVLGSVKSCWSSGAKGFQHHAATDLADDLLLAGILCSLRGSRHGMEHGKNRKKRNKTACNGKVRFSWAHSYWHPSEAQTEILSGIVRQEQARPQHQVVLESADVHSYRAATGHPLQTFIASHVLPPGLLQPAGTRPKR